MNQLVVPGYHKWNAKVAADSDLTFQCNICYKRLSKPIVSCITGHLFCHPCSERIPSCPLCNKDFTNNGNLALVNIMESTIFACENKQYGCKTIKIYTEIEDHEEKTCDYKKLQCCLTADATNVPCQGNTLLHEFRSHVETQHKKREKIYSDETLHKDVIVEFGRNINTVELIEVYNEDSGRSNFYLERIIHSSQKQLLSISYHYIGRIEQAKNYTYELKMIDSKDPNLFLLHKNHCLPIGLSDEHIHNSGRALIVCTRSLMSSMDRRKILNYSVKFDYIYNEKKFFKKKESRKFEKGSKEDLCCEEESKKCEEVHEECSVSEDAQMKNAKVVNEKTKPEELNKEKPAKEENEIEEPGEETIAEFSGRIIKTMFAPYVFVFCYMIFLYLFSK